MPEIMDYVEILKNGGVGILPTDTLYGVVGCALNEGVVQRIKNLKNRSDNKPFIILISKIEHLDLLKIDLHHSTRSFLEKVWPGPFSVVLDCTEPALEYLHEGMNLAVRWPKNLILENIINETGPLVAPSANPEGFEPATNIDKAKEYFGDKIDFYIDGGILGGDPSTLISIKADGIKILRQGRGILPNQS